MRKFLNDLEKKKLINRLRLYLIEKKEVKFSYIFGSFLSNLPFEDIDIGIYLDDDFIKNINKIDYILNLMIFLEEKFKGIEFDVVILNDLPFSFLFHIIKEGKLLFAREKDKYFDFVLYVINHYLDMKEVRYHLFKDNLINN
ncbi:MAG TPA: nucleotidyltransferase domain-containing protein [Caldisericia bacterium]|nr:nucleotidyltransferase domain-containing protein [Caldisericia bacterium]HPC57214.1 nucleotidyltransferase domain-containing protein [Caldisericia bacterium]HRT36741.1 nucleotidyltransferase domain-containing protein [Caldisericia bacterium]HRU73511.1 nucleotidyltransferase domain-containing protein [Caldisericia bacterium]